MEPHDQRIHYYCQQVEQSHYNVPHDNIPRKWTDDEFSKPVVASLRLLRLIALLKILLGIIDTASCHF